MAWCEKCNMDAKGCDGHFNYSRSISQQFKVGDRVKIIEHYHTPVNNKIGNIIRFDNFFNYLIEIEEFNGGHCGDIGDGSQNKWWVNDTQIQLVEPLYVDGSVFSTLSPKEADELLGLTEIKLGEPPGPYPKVIESEQIVMYDIDDTLVMWNPKVSDIYIKDPHSEETFALAMHKEHIKYLKQHKSRGYTNIVWSAGGYQWAKAVIDALELNEYVDLIMSKPTKFFDDLPAQEVLTNRVYLPFEE